MDIEFSICENVNARKCEKCGIVHRCKRCIKNTHICGKCGTMSYDCDICGTPQGSLSELKRHQFISKICKKARFLTARSFEEQIEKFGKVVFASNARRRKSVV
jgi:hypothetical protein